MRLLIYEGTPEEISQVAAKLPSVSIEMPMLGLEPQEATKALQTENDGFVDVKVARQVLGRRRLSPEQKQVLKAIYEAHPKRVPAYDLQNLVGYSASQFAGLMGAFGRRLAHTPIYNGEDWFFDQEWDYDLKANVYGLPAGVRKAMQLEKLV